MALTGEGEGMFSFIMYSCIFILIFSEAIYEDGGAYGYAVCLLCTNVVVHICFSWRGMPLAGWRGSKYVKSYFV